MLVPVPKKESTKLAREGPRAEPLPVEVAISGDACVDRFPAASGDISGEDII
jgi:hypothetical protein